MLNDGERLDEEIDNLGDSLLYVYGPKELADILAAHLVTGDPLDLSEFYAAQAPTGGATTEEND